MRQVTALTRQRGDIRLTGDTPLGIGGSFQEICDTFQEIGDTAQGTQENDIPWKESKAVIFSSQTGNREQSSVCCLGLSVGHFVPPTEQSTSCLAGLPRKSFKQPKAQLP